MCVVAKATKMSFKEKLIAKLVNNIQVELKNVHVRYEGQSKEKKDAFCFGATLGGLLFKVKNQVMAFTCWSSLHLRY